MMADVVKIATRDSYGNAVTALAAEHDDILVLDADLAGATKTAIFKKAYPDRHINCGSTLQTKKSSGSATTSMNSPKTERNFIR